MYTEPQCDLPEEIYKDWLADQGFDDLRYVDFASLIGGIISNLYYHCGHSLIGFSAAGYGSYREGGDGDTKSSAQTNLFVGHKQMITI